MRECVADTWLATCRRIANETRALVASMRQCGLDVPSGERGEGGDESLKLDLAAESVALRYIDQAAEVTGVRVVAHSEESGRVVLNDAATATVFVSIDPIDGSRNAQSGIPFAALSVALSTSDRMSGVEFGYIADLFRSDTYWAWRDDDGQFHASSQIAAARGNRQALAVVAIENAEPASLADVCASLPARVRSVRVLGSTAMALALLSTGGVDAVMSARPLRAFDVAAGQLLAQAAGCAIRLGPNAASLRAQTRVSLAAASTHDGLDSLKPTPRSQLTPATGTLSTRPKRGRGDQP
jgi:myo-inositol-1(or 4)-monophosphatase